jgi:hypothetical protein
MVVISITCRHGLGRRTAWNRAFRSIFPSTRENPIVVYPSPRLKSETHPKVLNPLGSLSAGVTMTPTAHLPSGNFFTPLGTLSGGDPTWET